MLLLTSFLLFIYISTLLAAPTSMDDAQAKTEEFKNFIDGRGNYNFGYYTTNEIYRYEKGTVVNSGQPDEYIKVEGSMSYLSPNGKIKKIWYKADENGYQILPSIPELSALPEDLTEPPTAAFGIGSPGGCAIYASLCG